MPDKLMASFIVENQFEWRDKQEQQQRQVQVESLAKIKPLKKGKKDDDSVKYSDTDDSVEEIKSDDSSDDYDDSGIVADISSTVNANK